MQTNLLLEQYDRFVRQGVFKGSHSIVTPSEVCDKIIKNIVPLQDKDKICVLYSIEFAIKLISEYNIPSHHIFYVSDHPIRERIAIAAGINITPSFENIDMKFDVVLGNPPFQDGNKEGGQNKIYNQISKRALTLLKDDGILFFITPTSVLKKSKRFSLIGQSGLSLIDFTVDKYFSEGVNICAWKVDRSHNDDVTIVIDDNTYQTSNEGPFNNYTITNDEFFKTYHALKNITNHPSLRMFKQNAVDTTVGRHVIPTNEYIYPVYKLDKLQSAFVQYNKPEPHFHKQLKFIVSMTKSLTNAIVFDTLDYDVNHLCIDIENEEQGNNIKSFILSDYFINHANTWKKVDGYGFNNALKHLPPFDKSKSWTNEEVKQFIESFIGE